jgi:hypothetical protein
LAVHALPAPLPEALREVTAVGSPCLPAAD